MSWNKHALCAPCASHSPNNDELTTTRAPLDPRIYYEADASFAFSKSLARPRQTRVRQCYIDRSMPVFATSRFGLLRVPAAQEITLPHGLIEFQQLRRFALVLEREGAPHLWLQSLEDAALAWPLVLPWASHPEYEPRVEGSDIDEMKIEYTGRESLGVWCLADLKQPYEYSTVNLNSPLLINTQLRIAKQIPHAAPYGTREPLVGAHTKGFPVGMRKVDELAEIALAVRPSPSRTE